MNFFMKFCTIRCVFFVSVLFSIVNLKSQTPGMIIEPASGSGSVILDPNGDGYVSATNYGFSSDDQSESEIPYTSLVFPGLEPNSDLNNAPNCGFTDFVDQGDRDPAQKYYNSSTGNWHFRFRMGSVSPNAKSYSILIDTDGKFGNIGSNADPNYSINNPGFEIELVLATKFGVFVFDVNTPNCTPVLSYTGNTNYQKSIALSSGCGDPDYFLDFFVPFSALQTQFGITPSTLMRYVIVDNTAAAKSTICNPSSASDVGGVGQCTNLASCFTQIINYQGMCAPNQSVCLARSNCPTIGTSAVAGASVITGSSTEANGSIVKLYVNGAYSASSAVSGGSWTISSISPTLASGDIIYVSVTASGKFESLEECNNTTITACTGSTAPSPTITNSTGKNFCGNGTQGYNISVYRPDFSLYTPNPTTSSYLPVPSGGGWVWKCTGDNGGCNAGSGVDCISEGGYMIFQVNSNGCKSFPAFACVSIGGGYSPVTSITPTITASTVSAGATFVQVNVGLNASPSPTAGYLHLFLNGAYFATSSPITSSGMATVACSALPGCSTLTAMFIQATAGSSDHDCFSTVSNSVAITGGVTSAPVILSPLCTSVALTSITGISSEADGTTVQLYENGVAEGAVATVSNGVWVASTSVSVAPGSTLTAKALAQCKTLSAFSASVLVGVQSAVGSTSITTTPLVEQGTAISGVGINGSIIQLFIDGSPLSQTTTVSGGTWTISGLSNYELYPGGIVSVSTRTGGSCSSPTVNGGTVICIPPTNTLVINPSSVNFCTNSGTTAVTVANSQALTIYQLFLANGTTTTGASVLGNGGTVTLSSGTLAATTTLQVKAIRPGMTCSAMQTDNVPVLFTVPITTLAASLNSNVICSGSSATVNVSNSQLGFVYQLRNNSNNAAIGSTVAGTGSSIALPTGSVTSNTSYNVLCTGPSPGNCTSSLSTIVSLTVSSTPTVGITNGTGTTTLTCTNSTINLSATGGNTYTWSSSLGTFTNAAVTSPGTYTVTGANSAGCTNTATISITQNTTSPTAGITNASGTTTLTCSNPTIGLTGTGGNTYQWSGGLGSAANATVSSSGIYTLTAFGSNGCSATTTISVTQNTATPSISISNNTGTSTITCTTPSISVSASGASTYTWSGGTSSAANATLVSSGNYTVSGTGANGCLGNTTIAIQQNTIAPSVNITNVSGTTTLTCGQTSIALSVSGASTYAWSNSLGTFTSVNVTAAGVYTVTGQSANGCTAIATTTITQSTGVPIITLLNNTGTSQLTCNNPSISLSISGGTAYTWTGGLPASANVTISSPGSYTATATGSSGCSSSTVISISQNTVVPTLTLTATYGSSVLNCTNTAITLSVSGANTYSWSNSATSTTISANSAGTYSVIGTGTNGCSSSTTQAITQNTTAPSYTLTNVSGTGTLTCLLGTIQMSVAGSNSYTWLPSNATTNSINITSAGTYTLLILGANGCLTNTVFTISQNLTVPAISFTANPPAVCAGSNATLTAIGWNTYTWTPTASSGSQITVTQTASVVYTVNGSYGSCAASATLSVPLNTCPIAVNDATNTAIGTTIVATVASNDTGTLNATFSITSQPTNGTITINSTTGQYTFTPASSFTGVTTATYQVCNGSPVICSSAVITISVYPLIAANTDTINTTPSVTATGTLLTNDNGIVTNPGATYSVSVTQLPTNTGTITVNPSTGQYTFTPNPAYAGTTLTTYTVCNTSVNPQICSTATILINVRPNPVAVNDATNTIINTPVSGNAAANDTGTLTGVFSITGQPSNGTVTINASTGQYTFTPATSFTGVTTATYQLCNGAPVTCSTAIITITVYPLIAANTDTAVTSSTASTSGTLTANDSGIVPGGSYSITITQPSSSTGTFVVNPTTGQYTFTPNSGFTGTASTTYTVCNISVNPIVCSSATIIIMVGNFPFAINDVTVTMINTPVSGSLGVNDNGTNSSLNPTFTVTQPTSGTITVTGATGLYTFTPASGFTGTVSTTYTLCNSLGCSAANVTFSVYPVLTAVDDVVNTTPSVAVTGTLLANDIGIVNSASLSANYSVTVAPPASSIGVIVVNPATGQYTFTPAAGYIGNSQTTYTVCNLNTVPVVCSTATIFINVKPNPLPAPDFSTTVEGISIVSNAGNNDQGVNGGTFAIVGQPNGGTVTIDPTTGQYTFAPTPSFTGVTTATYQLCNGAPVTCSTAVITITVYPQLVALNDVVYTTPSVAVNGTIVTNDLGVVTGANYTITVTPLDPTVGVIAVDPTTGQYTFTPDPAFTGTAATVYTICNISVNPQVCSSATIYINVYPNPVPVNDDNITVINTPVTGNAASNDLGTAGGTFSIVNQPSDGTISIDPSTGQYTYTPNSTYTGVVTATYQLCNGAPVTCSTAVISITVFPQLQAVADATTTGINTPVSGTLTLNDLGIVANANYSVNVSPVPVSNGTIVVNPATGQYTFTPASGYTGTIVTTYTVCQYTGTVALQCSSNTLVIIVGSRAAIGLAKKVETVKYNSDNTIDLTYKLTVRNLGNIPLSDITVSDDLQFIVPSPVTFTVVGRPTVKSSNLITPEATFTGVSPKIILTVPSMSSLAPDVADTIWYTVRVNPNGSDNIIPNTAQVTATGNGTTVTDNSVDGDSPDPDNDKDASNNTSATNFTIALVKLGVAKSISKLEALEDQCYKVEFKFVVKNLSNITAHNVSLYDDLDVVFGAGSYTASYPVSLLGKLKTDSLYTGSKNFTNLLKAGNSLSKGEADTITLEVRFCTNGVISYSNIAMIAGSSLPSGGLTYTNNSLPGTSPEGTSGNTTPAPTVFTPEPQFLIPEGFSPNGDGINDAFVIRGIDTYPNNKIRILNRWGNVVYEKDGYDNSWDGTSNRGINYGGDNLPEGTYFYILDLGDGHKAKTGFVYLNRSAKK